MPQLQTLNMFICGKTVSQRASFWVHELGLYIAVLKVTRLSLPTQVPWQVPQLHVRYVYLMQCYAL